MRLSLIVLASFAGSAYGGQLGRQPMSEELGTEEADDIDVAGENPPALESQATFNLKPGVLPPTNVGFCSTNPCTAAEGTDCCCWSNAAMPDHPTYSNPDQVEADRKCETPDDMKAMDLIMLKDPGCSGTSGRMEALAAVAPVYNDRSFCCAFHIDDPLVESLKCPSDIAGTPPPTTTWQPAPTVPPPPKSTPDPLLLQDSVAASMEKAAGDYMTAASAIHSTASDLESALASVKKEADVNYAKKQFVGNLRGILGHYIDASNAAVSALKGAVLP